MAPTGTKGVRATSMTGLRAAVFGFVILAIAACAPVFRNHGYVPTDDELAAIKVGEDTRETLRASVGAPSTSGLLNDTGWYYVQSRWKNSGALPPREIDRQVVAITFSEDGIVQNVERFGLDQGRVVRLSRRVTDSNIKGLSILRQLFGNVGRLDAGSLLE